MRFTGAGISLIEKINGENFLILFGNDKKNIIEDLGGRIDHGEDIYTTAQREAREESRNLINIDINIIKENSTPIYLKKYVSYVIYINNIDLNGYYDNVKLIDNKCKSNHWKETNFVVRIPIKNLKKGSKDVYDSDNILRRLRNRTVGVIDGILDHIKDIIKKDPIHLQKNIQNNSDIKCVNGAITYNVKQLGGYYNRYKRYKYMYLRLKRLK